MSEKQAAGAEYGPQLQRKYRLWRIRAFLGTWLAYAGFYICRKTLAVAQPEFMKEFGWGEEIIGIIITVYGIAYAAGQFINGTLGDKFGPKKVMITGLGLTVLMNILLGFSMTITMIGIFWTLNGYAQSCGWPSVVKGMTNWFSVRERGKVMGPWGTCYSVGDVLGTGLAAFVIGHVATQTITNPVGDVVTFANWRWVFWVGALVLTGISIIVFYLFKDKPEDVNLPNINEFHNIQSNDHQEQTGNILKNTMEILTRRPIWILGITYFGLKFIRYTFMFWIVTYLANERGFATDAAGYTSTIFTLVGILGTIVASYLSDKVFRSRRAPISVIMLLGLTASLFFLLKAPVALVPVALGLIGFMAYGPDFVISAVAVMDFGSQKGAATAAGFVNGMGSIGQALSGVVIGFVAGAFGWQAVFQLLIWVSLACAALIATLWNKVGTN